MRDLLISGFLLIFVVLSFRSTYAAYLLWGWAGLISLNAYVYGFMASVPFVQIFAVIALIDLFVRKDFSVKNYKTNRTTILFSIFLFHCFMCALFAYPGLVSNWELFWDIFKTILFCALMPLLADSRTRLHSLVVMIALAISFHGITDGLKFLVSAGGHNARGIPKFGDNNHFAMVLAMALPIIFYLTQYSAKKIIRWGFWGVVLLTVLAVVATNSRGGLLGLFAVAFWFILKSNRKFIGALVIGISAVMVTQLAPESWTERMQTIKSAEDDASFMSRVTAWKVSSAIAVTNPVFGGGFKAVQSHAVWAEFKDSPGILGFIDTPVTRSGVAAHSIWFQVLGDLGFLGLFIFIALIANAFITLREIKTMVKKADSSWRWAGDLANMLGAVMFVYVVSGSALSAAYFELPYIVMMLIEVIKQVLRSGLKSPSVLVSRGTNG